MAHSAHLEILAAQPLRVKARAVRIEAPASLRRVTRQAVTLGVTTDAGFQTLAGRAAVAGNKE
jgi:hypothetical protein